MPLVFVHGVNVRRDSQGVYERAVQQRNAFFAESVLRSIAADPANVFIRNPYWGDYAATFPWGHLELPESEYEKFGPDSKLQPDEILPAIMLSGLVSIDRDSSVAPLRDLARKSLEAAVDLLVVTASDPQQATATSIAPKVALLGAALGAYAYDHRLEIPKWIDEVQTDTAFVDCLIEEAEQWQMSKVSGDREWESFGGVSNLWKNASEIVHNASDRVARAGRRIFRKEFRDIVRDPLNRTLAQFIGDVLVYQNTRDKLGDKAPILATIIQDLEQADGMRSATSESFVVIAHSMGGNIVYDILTYFRPKLKVDFFVTVGSQTAIFEELRVFKNSDMNIPCAQVPKVPAPKNVTAWLNVFDHSDILAFAGSKVFEGVADFEYNTGALFGAHGSYFNKPSFHHRLGLRVRGIAK